MLTAKEFAALKTQRLGRGATSAIVGDTFTTKVEVDPDVAVAEWQNLGTPVHQLLGDGSVVYKRQSASPLTPTAGQLWLEDVSGQTRLKFKSVDGSIVSLGGSGVSISAVYVVADQAARLALTALVGDAAKQLDTGETFLLQATPSSTNSNWVLVGDITPDWGTITNKPTTISGFGITDGVSTLGSYANPSWITSLAWSKISGTPTTVSGYGITDGVSTSGSYTNPAWIASLAWSKISSTPTTLVGYGITDGQPLNTLLTSISGLGTGNGVLAQNGTGFIRRSVLGTAGQVTVTGGDGTSDITLSLPSSITQSTTFTSGLSLQVAGTALFKTYSNAASQAGVSIGVSDTRRYTWVRDTSDNLLLYKDMTAVAGTAATIATISATGNLGWGTATSSYLVDIGGTTHTSGLAANRPTSSSTPSSYLSTLRSDSIVDITSGSGETHRSLSIHAQSTQNYIIEVFGNVNVSPSPALQVKGDGTVVATRVQFPHTTAPSTPADGEVWTTTAGMYVRVNGTTVGPLSATTGTVTGTGVANRVAYWSGTSALTSSASLTYDGTNLNFVSGALQIGGTDIFARANTWNAAQIIGAGVAATDATQSMGSAGLRIQPSAGLGSAIGDRVNILQYSVGNSNTGYLRVYERRYVAGSTWTSASARIQRTIDGSEMDFIDFRGAASYGGNTALVIGTGSTDVVTVTGGLLGIGIVPTAGYGVLQVYGDIRVTNATGIIAAPDGSYFGIGVYYKAGTGWTRTTANQGGAVIRNTSGQFEVWTGAAATAAVDTTIAGFARRFYIDGAGNTVVDTGSLTVAGSVQSGSGAIYQQYTATISGSSKTVRIGVGVDPGGSGVGTFYAGMYVSTTEPELRIGALEGGVSWRNIVLANAGGNVGIGRSPSYRFDVNTGTNLNLGVITNGSSIGLYSRNDANSALIPFSIQASQIDFRVGSGNVLVGQFDGGGTLTVTTNTSPQIRIIGGASGGAALEIDGQTGLAGAGRWRIGDGVGTSNGVLTFYDYKNSVGRMYLDATGQFGIGGVPFSRLHVEGNANVVTPSSSTSRAATLSLIDTANSGGAGGVIEFGGKASTTFAAIKGSINDGTSYSIGSLLFFTRNAIADTAMSLRMQIDVVGNVVIGSTATAAGGGRYLDIYNLENTTGGSAAITRYITYNAAGAATTSADIAKYRNGAWTFQNYEPGGSGYIQLLVNSGASFYVTQYGVGVGGYPSAGTFEKFRVESLSTSTANDGTAAFLLNYARPSGAASRTYYAAYCQINADVANNNLSSSNIIGVEALPVVNLAGTGTVNAAFGLHGYPQLVNGGGSGTTVTVNSVYGMYSTLYMAATNAGATMLVGNYYGLFLATPNTVTGSGTKTITNRYGIYQEDTTAFNVLSGNTQVGVASSKHYLRIDGGNAAANEGSYLWIVNGGSSTGALGNYSAVHGGAYVSTMALWGSSGIYFGASGLTTAMYLDTVGRLGVGNITPVSGFGYLQVGPYTSAVGDQAEIASFCGTSVATGTTNTANVAIHSYTAYAQDMGGSLGLGGRYNTTQFATFAMLKGSKGDSVLGNYGGYLSLLTRINGGNLVEHARLTQGGNLVVTAAAPDFTGTPSDGFVGRFNVSTDYGTIMLAGTDHPKLIWQYDRQISGTYTGYGRWGYQMFAGISAAIVPGTDFAAGQGGTWAVRGVTSSGVATSVLSVLGGSGTITANIGDIVLRHGAITGGRKFVTSTTVSINNTTSQLSLLGTVIGSNTLPANTFKAGTVLRITAWGYYGTAASTTYAFTLQFGVGGATFSVQTATLPASLSGRAWYCTCTVICTSDGPSGTLNGEIGVYYKRDSSTADLAGFAQSSYGGSAVNTTSSLNVLVTGQWNTANVSNVLSCTQVICEII